MAIPTHKEWIAVKKKFGVADKAGKNSVGKALDAYWKSNAKTPKEYQVALTKLEAELNKYITTIDKKKVKQYDAFQREFLNKYLGQAHKEKNDTMRAMATLKTYQAEIAKFMTAVQKLDPAKTKKVDIDRFKSGPVRGMTAMARSVRGLSTEQVKVLNDINGWLGTIDKAIDTMPNTVDRQGIKDCVLATRKTAEKIADLAEAGKII